MQFQPSSPKLLAVSFCFPPLAYPRSIHVARLLNHIRFKTLLVCADEKGARQDPTIEPDAEAHLQGCLRVPFSPDGWSKRANRIFSWLDPPLWNKIPDQYTSWKGQALEAVKNFARDASYKPDIIVTFGQPMSDHLIGLELKRLYRVPWVAHFSDPWVDNPFNLYDRMTRRVNVHLEKKVITNADRLIFTSQETIELVLAKYREDHRARTRVIPHSFDASLYPPFSGNGQAELTIRYIGEFYGKRTPKPLVETLRAIMASTPGLLTGVRFELIGPTNSRVLLDSGLESLPEGLIVTRPSVNYQESLRLAASADGLLIVDAPAERSVFLPSKLIDYVGAGRPILGLTPRGTAAGVINDLGGWVADPADAGEMKLALESFLRYLSENRDKAKGHWGSLEVRERYEAPAVAALFENVLRELLS